VVLCDSMFSIFFCKPVDVVKGFPSGPADLMKVSATSGQVVNKFLARASAHSSPIMSAWDLIL